MGMRGRSEHAEGFHSPLRLLVAVPGEAARPRADTHHPFACSQRRSQAAPGLAWPPGMWHRGPPLTRSLPTRGDAPWPGWGRAVPGEAARDPQSPR